MDEDNVISSAYSYDPPQEGKSAYDVAHGFYPACDQLIVMLREGHMKKSGEYEYLGDPEIEHILYPLGSKERRLDPLAPANVRRDFDEAVVVLPYSRKASAAISRRLLQGMLRDSYGIKRKSLAAEIDAFAQLPHIPSYLAGAVDAVRHVGNFAAHPVKDIQSGEVVDVEDGEAEWLLEVIETLSDFTFVQPKRLAERREKLNEKLRALGKEPMKGVAAPPVDGNSGE